MRKFTLLIASLFITVGAMAQVDYTPTNTGAKPRTNRLVSTITVGGDTYTMPTGTEATRNSYTDLTATKKFKVQVGATVNLAMTDDPGDWMNAFVYVDTDNNGFTAGVEADGYTPTGDLVSFSFYSNSSTVDTSGKNSAGTAITTDAGRNSLTLPSWTVPEDLTPGEYRIRFKYDWNNIDPDGGEGTYFGNTFTGHGGEIIDATLEVVEFLPEYTITYNYKQGDVLIGSISHKVTEGAQYPDLISAYGVTVNGTKPEGVVSEDGEFEFDVTIGEMPFEYYEDYAAVEEANGWYNLIMHSNWNTGNGTARYRTYLSHNESGSTLAWGTERSLTNPSDAHYWAFVGNPINGFRVVNKATGAEKVLSSNGTTNPLMIATEGMADGYNTTWAIANRKYNVSTQGDYILEGAWFCLKYPGSNNYINANAGNGNVAFWNDNDNGSGILAVKPLEINEAADVATYYSDNYITIPSTLGAEVYYVNNVEGGYAKFEQITSEVIPAQTGVVVKYAVESNVVYAPEITSQGTTTAVEGNLLKGTTKRTLISKDANKSYYVLGMTDGVGFYNAVNGANENEFYNGAFKAYLELPAAQGTAAFYGFDWDGTTGIDEVKGENGNVKVVYDLTGRKIDTITKAGIYIINGKKVLVK